MVVMTPRGSWTDERLDEFGKRVDERFDEVNRRLDEVDRRFDEMNDRINELERKVDAGFAAMATRWDRTTGILIVVLLGLIGTQI